MIGLITPPYGLLLFIASSLSKAPLVDVIKETIPWIIVLVAALLVMTYVPETVLWLPKLLGYKAAV
jgi:TRAP-type C4-dicarboxylate transport system permease large subunit